MGGLFQIFWKGQRVPEIRPPPTFWSMMVGLESHGKRSLMGWCHHRVAKSWTQLSTHALGTVMAPLSLLICYSEDQGLVKVDLSAILDPWDSNLYAVSLGYVILAKGVPCPLPSCFTTTSILWTHSKLTINLLILSNKIIPLTHIKLVIT